MVLDWFRSQRALPVEQVGRGNYTFYFREFGPLSDDPKKCPVVNVFTPVRKLAVLLTCGEIHFLATPLSQFPALATLNRDFRKWLSQFPCVFSRREDFERTWDYYLEGQIRNYDSDVFALPQAMEALRDGQYFVANDDNDWVLDKVCRELKKRGVPGIV